MAQFVVQPKALREPEARQYVGMTEDRFRAHRKSGLIEPIDGTTYLIEELDALLNKLRDRREKAKILGKAGPQLEVIHGDVPPKEKALRGTKKVQGRGGEAMSRILLGTDR